MSPITVLRAPARIFLQNPRCLTNACRALAQAPRMAYRCPTLNQLCLTVLPRTLSTSASNPPSGGSTGGNKVDVAGLVRSARVVVFMKGSPDDPSCGFSNAVCRILEMHGVLDKAKLDSGMFESHDVLTDSGLREQAKLYSDWPTYPQVYFDGDFVGGCDIMLELHKSGQLSDQLTQLGIGSKLPGSDSVSNEDQKT